MAIVEYNDNFLLKEENITYNWTISNFPLYLNGYHGELESGIFPPNTSTERTARWIVSLFFVQGDNEENSFIGIKVKYAPTEDAKRYPMRFHITVLNDPAHRGKCVFGKSSDTFVHKIDGASEEFVDDRFLSVSQLRARLVDDKLLLSVNLSVITSKITYSF